MVCPPFSVPWVLSVTLLSRLLCRIVLLCWVPLKPLFCWVPKCCITLTQRLPFLVCIGVVLGSSLIICVILGSVGLGDPLFVTLLCRLVLVVPLPRMTLVIVYVWIPILIFVGGRVSYGIVRNIVVPLKGSSVLLWRWSLLNWKLLNTMVPSC